MSRLLKVVLLVGLVGGGWYACTHYELEVHNGPQGLEYVKIHPRGDQDNFWSGVAGDAPPSILRPAVRIATFNLTRLDENKLANRRVGEVLAQAIARFDVVAVQDIRARNQGVLLRLIERINATGRQFDFAVCPTVQRANVEQYNAFLFDRAALEVDRSTVHSIKDAAGKFRHTPLVTGFRVRGPAATEAFTFTLIDVQIDPERVAAELDLLAEVYRAVRDDGRNEDDVILLGTLSADHEHLGLLGRNANISWAVAGVPTTARGTALVDNILFDRRATIEFTGRSGVVDLLREFNLTMPEAAEVSEHLPVWAEFSSYEGGQAGQVQ